MNKVHKRNNIEPAWSSNFAYAMGLLATDGCLSPDGRHFDLTSKDKEQLVNFMHCLNIKVKIGSKISTYTKKKTPRIQFGSIKLYKFLLNVGFTPRKTKTIGALRVPKKYIFDFLRGHLDGDGCFYSYWDPRWKSSFMFYTVFTSSSRQHIEWIQKTLKSELKIKGHITRAKFSSVYNLKFAKKDSKRLLKKIYYSKDVVCLSRKRLKIEKALGIMDFTL